MSSSTPRVFPSLLVLLVLTAVDLLGGPWGWWWCVGATGFNTTNICDVPRTVKFLQTAPLTGSNNVSGIQLRDGILAAIRQFNNEGGLGRVNVDLVEANDMYNATLTVSLIKQYTAIPGDIFAVIGAVGTSNVQAAIPVTTSRGIPLIGAKTGGMAVLREPFNRYVINFRASYVDESAALVDLLLSMGKTRIALFYQNDSLGDAGHLGVIGALNSSNMYLHSEGGHSKTIISTSTLDLEISRALSKMNSTGKFPPDAIVMATVNVPATRFVLQAHQLWPDVFIAGLSSVMGEDLMATMNATGKLNLLKNMFFSQTVPMPSDASLPVVVRYQDAVRQYLASDKKPTVAGLEGYLSARVALVALERSRGVFTPESFLDAIYDSGYVNMDGFRCGAFLPREDQGGCNQCMHQVIMTKALANATLALVDEVNPLFNFTTCGYKAKQWQKLRLGMTCSFTGPQQANCESFRDGLLAAFRSVNDQDGIRGSTKLELIWHDDLDNDTLALETNLQFLADDDVFGLVGTSSAVIDSIAALASSHKKPVFGPYNGELQLREPFNRFVVNFRASQRDEFAALVEYCYYDRKLMKISLLYEDSVAAYKGKNDLVTVLGSKRLKLHSASVYTKDGSNLTEAIAQVLHQQSSLPEVIVVIGYGDVMDQVLLGVHKYDKGIVVFGLSRTALSNLFGQLTSSNASSFLQDVNIQNLVLSSCVPDVSDTSIPVVAEYALALSVFDPSLSTSFAGLEGFMVGNFLAMSLQRVIAKGLSPIGTIDAIYDSGNFNLMGTHCGPLVDADHSSQDTTDASSACNQCMKRVWLVGMDEKGVFSPEADAFSFSSGECMFLPSPNVDFQLRGMRLAMVVVATIGNLYVIVIAALLVLFRQHVLIRSGLKFSLVSCLGAVMCFSSVYLLYPIPTDTICAVEPFAADLSFVTLFGPLFAKTRRIDKLFNNKKLKKLMITDAQVFRMFIVLLMVFVVFLVTWTIASRRTMQEDWTLDGRRFERCVSPIEQFQYAAFAMKALVLLWGCFLCERVYKIGGDFAHFNESKQIVLCIYNTSFMALLVMMLMFLVKDPNTYFAVFTGLLMANTFITVTVLFGRPLHSAMQKVIDLQVENETSTPSQSTNNSNNLVRGRIAPLDTSVVSPLPLRLNSKTQSSTFNSKMLSAKLKSAYHGHG